MTGKERIQAILQNQPTDRVPFAVLDSGAWIACEAKLSIGEVLSLPDAGARLIVDAFERINADMISAASGCAVAFLDAIGCRANLDKKGAPVDVFKCIDDPEIDIPQLDTAAIRPAFERNWVFQRILTQARGIKALAGGDRFVNICLAGPFTIAGIMVGTQELMMMLVDEEMEELLVHLLDYATEVCVVAHEMLADAGVDIAWFGEPTSSGEMISTSMFDEKARECIQTGYDRLKDRFRYIFMHMCGNSSARVNVIQEMGFDAFSVDAPVDLARAIRDCENKMVMIGNVGPASPLSTGTPEEVTEAARSAVEKAHGHLILCPGCDLPCGTPIENIEAMRQAAITAI